MTEPHRPFGRVLGIVLFVVAVLITVVVNGVLTFKCHPPLEVRLAASAVSSSPFVGLAMLGAWLNARARGKSRRTRDVVLAGLIVLAIVASGQTIHYAIDSSAGRTC